MNRSRVNRAVPDEVGFPANWHDDWRLRFPDLGYFGTIYDLNPGQRRVTDDGRHIVFCAKNGDFVVRENVCPHAGNSVCRKGEGDSTQLDVQSGSLACSAHRWAFDDRGRVTGAPHFDRARVSLYELPYVPTRVWRGHILGIGDGHGDLSILDAGHSLGHWGLFNMVDYVRCGRGVVPLPYERPRMKDNYLDGLHVPYRHVAFAQAADVGTYEWDLGPLDNIITYALQSVSENTRHRQSMKPVDLGTGRHPQDWPHLNKWLIENLTEVCSPVNKTVFALWWASYAHHLMCEAYCGALLLAVSYLETKDGDKSGIDNINVVDFYLHRNIPVEFRMLLGSWFQEAYWKTAREDDDLCLEMRASHRGFDELPHRLCHPVLEKGVKHYHDWAMRHAVIEP